MNAVVDQPLRIVTTNFDDLLSQITPGTKEYVAPALPDGVSAWNGIVYLHGKASDPTSQLVLTDEDFGNAYLLRQYCLRFLIDLFQNNHVLFLGYSMNDAIPQYLNRAIGYNATFKRWALCEDSESEKWKSLQCTPISYPNKTHEQLWDSLSHFGTLLSRGAKGLSDHWELILKQPAHHATSDDFDGFLFEFHQQIGLSHLLKEPRNISWLKAITERGHLRWVTQAEIAPPNHDGQWMSRCAVWVASYFRKETFKDLQYILISPNGFLHPYVVQQLTWMLHSKNSQFSEEEIFQAFAWLQTKPLNQNHRDWAMLCHELIFRYPENLLVWRVFKSLLQVQVHEEWKHKDYDRSKPRESQLDWKIGYDDEYHLAESWKLIKPLATKDPENALLFFEGILREYLAHTKSINRPSIASDGDLNYWLFRLCCG